MITFNDALQQKLATFLPYATQTISLSSPVFQLANATVHDFLNEIQETATQLNAQKESEYSEYYAQKLVRQFDALQQAVEKAQKNANTLPQFKSAYRFPKNLHHLPAEKRLPEYRKALRALNEKLAWLSEQIYVVDDEQKPLLVAQIQETEYRKLKCLQAIELLEWFLQNFSENLPLVGK